MKAKHAPNLAALLIFAFCLTLKPGQAQLPPTNMSKHVRTPGDNQYQSEGRQFRHAPPPPPAVRQGPGPGQSSMPAWRKTPAPRVPDITLEPIAADEPVCQAGFPPLPDRLELPIANMGSKWNSSGGGGGAAPGGGGRQIQTSMHQHYKHITPGAYAPAKNNQAPQTGGGGGGYYKARTPQRSNADYYSTGGPAMPKYMGADPRALKRLGKEPKLEEGNSEPAQPEAPTPVVVSQTKTQDLSLPEDEFEASSSRNQNRTLKRFGKQVKRTVRRGANRARSMAPTGF